MNDLELLKEYLQSEIDCGNHKLFIFDENNNATELKTIDGLNAITDLEQEIERLNNIINQFEEWLNDLGAWCYVEKLKELKETGNNE